jgi:pimeloyl-ACP methyl ester carboxylesterase
MGAGSGPSRVTVHDQWHDVRGLRMFSRVAGSGTSVVLVHGAGVSTGYWQPAQRALAAGGRFRVYSVDLPGFGRTETPPHPPELPRLAEHLGAWLEQVVPEPYHLVGQSLGCEIAVLCAAERPASLRTLTLAAPAGLPTLRSLWGELFRAALDAPRESLALFGAILPAYLRCGPARLLGVLLEQKRYDFPPLLRAIHVPTLVLRGAGDTVATAERIADVAALVQGSCVATIPGAHGAHFTHAEAFTETLGSFLERHAAGTARRSRFAIAAREGS